MLGNFVEMVSIEPQKTIDVVGGFCFTSDVIKVVNKFALQKEYFFFKNFNCNDDTV